MLILQNWVINLVEIKQSPNDVYVIIKQKIIYKSEKNPFNFQFQNFSVKIWILLKQYDMIRIVHSVYKVCIWVAVKV